jgi:hypothetical protein
MACFLYADTLAHAHRLSNQLPNACTCFPSTIEEHPLIQQRLACSPQSRQDASQGDASSALYVIIKAAVALLIAVHQPVWNRTLVKPTSSCRRIRGYAQNQMRCLMMEAWL